MKNLVSRKFGTERGAIRLALSYLQVAAGRAHIHHPRQGSIKRLVFLCHGNICRSPFAEQVAKDAGMATAGFGLSTQTGSPAHPPVAENAAKRGVDLSSHRSTAMEDFAPEEGDLLIAMEVRHLAKLAQDERFREFPRVLLGSYNPAMPIYHIHDPYTLDAAYLDTCLDRIHAAVMGLKQSLIAQTLFDLPE